MHFTEAAASYLTEIKGRSRRPSANTLRQYHSHASRLTDYWKDAALADIKNGAVKKFITALKAEDLSPSSIQGIYSTLRAIVYSVRDEDGQRLYQQPFDTKWIDVPTVSKTEQPCATSSQIEKSLSTQVNPLVALLSATGLRVSEALSLSCEASAEHFYDASSGMVHLRKGKTENAARLILLPSAFAEWFNARVPTAGKLFKHDYQQVNNELKEAELPPCHAYRRFYISYMRKVGMHESVLKNLVGHSGGDTTDRYDKSGKELDFMRSEVEKCGLGFALKA